MTKITEEKSELCSVATKIVVVKITREKRANSSEGIIIGFECNSQSTTCENRCTYRMLLDDF